MTIDLKWIRSGDTLVAILLGRIDSGSADHFQELLEDGLGPDDRKLVLDFERVSMITSAGLRVCLVIAKRFAKPGKRFAICSLSELNREVVAISGFDRIIDVHESRDAALAALGD